MENKELNNLFEQEIENCGIDEFTNSYLENICKTNNCSAIEFREFLLVEKQFQVFQHPAGFYIYQKPKLNFQELIDAIVKYHSNNNLEYHHPPFKYKTLYEIASDYHNLELSKDGYSFSMKHMITKLS